MTIFVTGGTGYLGSHVVDLLQEAGMPARLFVRDAAKVEAAAGIETVEGDVSDAAAVAEAMRGCDRVAHMAAHVSRWPADGPEFDRVNVQGTINVLDAATRYNVERVVYTSSFMALGPSGEGVADEQFISAGGGFINGYHRTKTLALEEVQKRTAAGLPVVVLMPAVMIGPGKATAGNYLRQFVSDFASRRLPGILGDGECRLTLVGVRDAARAHLSALEHGTAGSRFLIAGEVVTVNELCALLQELTGVAAPRRHIPFAVASALAALMEVGASITGGEPRLTRHEVEVFKHDWAYDGSLACRELGLQPQPVREVLRQALEDLQLM